MQHNAETLDRIDRQILAELDKNCRISDNELAKKIRRSRQTVAYRINQLVSRGIITGFTTSINPNRMGFQMFKVYLKVRNIPERKAALLDELRKSMHIYWMGECDGSWDLIFDIYAKDYHTFYDLKNRIMSDFKDIIVDFYGDILFDVQQFPKMYFTNELSGSVDLAGDTVQNELDDLDHKILNHIIARARAPTIEIARQVSSTPATISSRMKRMEKLGIILQYRIGVDLVKLGLEHYKAIIKTESYSKEEDKQLLEYCSQIPQIQYFIRNLWQLEPEFVVKNYDEYYGIINKLKARFPNTIRTVDPVLLRSDEWTPGYQSLLNKE